MRTGLIVGSGRQSEAVIKFLSATEEYHLLVFTRSTTSRNALYLAALPDVDLITSTVQSG
jgi:saccharopine dehydrogenase-like NADP-dependent oxidoreductase